MKIKCRDNWINLITNSLFVSAIFTNFSNKSYAQQINNDELINLSSLEVTNASVDATMQSSERLDYIDNLHSENERIENLEYFGKSTNISSDKIILLKSTPITQNTKYLLKKPQIQQTVKDIKLLNTQADSPFRYSTSAKLLKPDSNDSNQQLSAIPTPVEEPNSTTPSTTNTGGEAPSLHQPSQPGQAPFQPRRIPLRPRNAPKKGYAASPGITTTTPSAYGKGWGSTGIGVGYQARTRFKGAADGGIGLGFGLGDARKLVGLDVGVSFLDLSDFGNRGSFNFKLHRVVANNLAIAVGWQNAVVWGFTDAGNSIYGVATRRFDLKDSLEKPFSRLYVSAGVGNGQYRSESDINKDIDSVGVFGSVALRVAEPVSAIAEWTGQDLTLGVSYVPFKNIPLVVTPAVTDITHNAGDGARLIMSVGYGFTFR